MNSQQEQFRIKQLISSYSPDDPPQLPLSFGDYLSLLWRLDRAAGHDGRTRYYRHCAIALSDALGFRDKELGRISHNTQPGDIYATLGHLPYRRSDRVSDAADRRAAIGQLVSMRWDVLSLGSYSETWNGGWPGHGINDSELRDRVYAILFTALPAQYPVFARVLLVLDIVLQELLLGTRKTEEIHLGDLVERHGYPNPDNQQIHELFAQEQIP